MQVVHSNGQDIVIENYPDFCPFCQKSITPVVMFGYHRNDNYCEIFMRCPNPSCLKSFIGYYHASGRSYIYSQKISQGNLIRRNFDPIILATSNSFVKIYNEGYAAEQQDLLEICGVGYRKALEFLIKDYIIAIKPEEKEKVEEKMLAVCISEYIDDTKIKSVAKRAAWLGNDETHYVRKWEGKNLQDLKKLIDLTIHWIEMEALTSSFEEEMPD